MYITQKKEQFSIAYISALAATLGFNPGTFNVDDDSVDISFKSKGYNGKVRRNPQIDIQLKCTKEKINKHGSLSFPLPVKNYNDLRDEYQNNPTYLIVLIVPENENNWIETRDNDMLLRNKAYWFSLRGMPETDNETTVTIHIPVSNELNVYSFKMLMDYASEGKTYEVERS